MDELRKCFETRDWLQKAASLLEAQIAEADRQLTRIEQEDEARRSFLETVFMAPGTVTLH
jgi:hypothetical protein